MNNKEFISALSQRTGYSQEDTQRLVNNLVTAMGNEFMNGESVNIAGFGTFDVKKRLERVLINPSSKKRMLVPPKLILNFRPAASVKEKLKKGGEA